MFLKQKTNPLVQILKAIICVLLIVVTLYPFWHVFMYSFSDPRAAMGGGIFLWPREFSTEPWKAVLKTGQIFSTMRVSVAKTLVGTTLSLVLSVLTAYPLSLPYFKGRTLIQGMIFFTMLFSGGTIPTYILLKDLHLLNTFWVYVLPGAISAYNMFILRNFFLAIPDSLTESAMLDGANHMQILVRIVLPLSKAAIATQVMFYGVSYWNSYMDGVLYVNEQSLQLMQVYLRDLIQFAGGAGGDIPTSMSGETVLTEESVKMATIALSLTPVMIVYLSLQKYFIKGTMVGSVKG